MDASRTFSASAFVPASLSSLTRRDVLWLVPCTISLWFVGVILALDDAGSFFRGNEPAAPILGACGIVLGVFGIWRWRQWLIRDLLLRPAHDTADDVLWLCGATGAIIFYLLLTPPTRLLPPNAALCIFSGLAGAKLLYSGMTRRIGNTLHCSRCNYHIEDTSLPRRCPECSGIWAHRLVRGKIVPSNVLISAGVILLFILTLAPIPRFQLGRAFIRRQMSTAWIASQAASSLQAGNVSDAELWQELGKRKLTEQQALPLSTLILQQTANNTLSDNGAYRWLEELVFSGGAPRSAADAFMDLALTFQLSMPTTSLPGRQVPISIQAVELRRIPGNRVAIYLEQLTDDADPAPLRTGSHWETLRAAMQPVIAPASPAPPPETPAFADNLGNVAAPFFPYVGTQTVRARFWAAIVPPDTPPSQTPEVLAPLYFDPNVKPPVIWLKQYELRAEILIRESRAAPKPIRPLPKPAKPGANPVSR
ncbi:MAG: hypothetical protein JNM86_06735 [Phycisphaerae bacterium]|nr:hypothetical protein [Phycisphaerae bacterium]